MTERRTLISIAVGRVSYPGSTRSCGGADDWDGGSVTADGCSTGATPDISWFALQTHRLWNGYFFPCGTWACTRPTMKAVNRSSARASRRQRWRHVGRNNAAHWEDGRISSWTQLHSLFLLWHRDDQQVHWILHGLKQWRGQARG